jgi:secreted PhoX family phosphatase
MDGHDFLDASDDDDQPIARPWAMPLAGLVARRTVLKGLGAGLGLGLGVGLGGSALGPIGRPAFAETAPGRNPSTLGFEQPPHVIADGHAVAPGHDARVLIRWGDAVMPDAPAFDPRNLTAAAQERQFGANNDFIAFLPLPAGSAASDHGLLCVNHEYTNTELMWPGLGPKDRAKASADQAAVEMAAHGLSVIEVRKTGGQWSVAPDSAYARRISLRSTPMILSGPVARHPRLRTAADPTGAHVLGTLNNCAGGKTPWGTVLTAEENIHQYFSGTPDGPEAANHARMGIKGKPRYSWGRHAARFDVLQEPNEPNRFGWMVEIDPYDPTAAPKKRTALGRFKHEGAGLSLTQDGRCAVYSGDDQAFEYLYRFVTDAKVDAADRAANRDILDHGTLYVARLTDDGRGVWLALTFGQGPLTPANGFRSQADVLIETRRAADLLGATPLDRPEDVEPNPVSGRAYVMLTNNTKRTPDQADAANPRGPNPFGHVLEITPAPGADGRPDHGAASFTWDILLQAGDPAQAGHGARYHPATGRFGAWLAAPDNCAFDPRGRLWISTDQGSKQKKNAIPDGMYACDLDGPGRALTRFFFACPRDAEMCGPEFTPDGTTLFVAVQHPAEGSTFDQPSTRWPDFQDGMPPRAAIVAITRRDGGPIGG